MQDYVVKEPQELMEKINDIIRQIQPLWNAGDFRGAEQLFEKYYETMRAYEEALPEGKRLHKGTPLHNWGISILLQQPSRITEGLEKVFLAYIEDLMDFDSIEEVHSAPAYKTLYASPFDVEALRFAQSYVEELKKAKKILKDPAQILTPKLKKESHKALQEVDEKKPKTVFVVYGRNFEAKKSMYEFLKSIGLNPINLTEAMLRGERTEGEKVTPYIGEQIDFAFSLAQAVVVLMTPDDIGCLRKVFRKSDDQIHDLKFTPQARLNVIFEAGYAMGGQFRRNRTIIVQLGRLRQLSDWAGLFMVKLDNSIEKRQDLIARLKKSGCAVDDSDGSWQSAGDFVSVIKYKENYIRRFFMSIVSNETVR